MKCIVNVCVSILLCVTVPALHWTVMALHLLYSTSVLPFGLISHLLPSLWRGKYQMNLFSSAFWSSLCTRSHRLSLTVPFVYVFIMFCVTGTSRVDISHSVSLPANTVGGSVCPSPRFQLCSTYHGAKCAIMCIRVRWQPRYLPLYVSAPSNSLSISVCLRFVFLFLLLLSHQHVSSWLSDFCLFLLFPFDNLKNRTRVRLCVVALLYSPTLSSTPAQTDKIRDNILQVCFCSQIVKSVSTSLTSWFHFLTCESG